MELTQNERQLVEEFKDELRAYGSQFLEVMEQEGLAA